MVKSEGRHDVEPIRDHLELSWHTKSGGLLTSGWTESEGSESYRPAWMQSSYPDESKLPQSIANQSALSPFGKLR